MLENTLWQGINSSFYPIPLTGWRSLSLSTKWLSLSSLSSLLSSHPPHQGMSQRIWHLGGERRGEERRGEHRRGEERRGEERRGEERRGAGGEQWREKEDKLREELGWGWRGQFETTWLISCRNVRRCILGLDSSMDITLKIKLIKAQMARESWLLCSVQYPLQYGSKLQCLQHHRPGAGVLFASQQYHARWSRNYILHKPLNKPSTNPKIVQSLLNISGTRQLGGGNKRLLSFSVAIQKQTHTCTHTHWCRWPIERKPPFSVL